MTRTISVFSPAKVNLFLHVLGTRQDGYHLLDSLVAFADIGDRIQIEPAERFSFRIQGPFASAFQAADRDESRESGNLAVRAVWAVADAAGRTPSLRLTLTKNLPVAAGIGGGSANAAAVLWGLLEWWRIPVHAPWLPALMLSLGADVPVCLHCRPALMRGIGDQITDAPPLPEMPVLLVNPLRACPTPQIFRRYDAAEANVTRGVIDLPPRFDDQESVVEFLRGTDNHLTPYAMEIVPDIGRALAVLAQARGCALARMSGSGATCFGVFETEDAMLSCAEELMQRHPQWWVRTGWLNRIQRY